MPLLPGTRVGPYEIVAPLGTGGMGEVYRARDSRLGRDVAIKSLPPAFVLDPERLHRFEREARTLASLNHPNIAALYGLEDVAGVPHLVLELVDGETLAARLEREALPARGALDVCTQIAAAIEAAHERGVVHRDLKPGNVMLTTNGVVKVLDFGLAKSGADGDEVGGKLSRLETRAVGATVAGSVLGTAAYMSPEQARGKPVELSTDVWSFGCVLYECLTGRPAFSGETGPDMVARILERDPDWSALPAETSSELRDVLRRCLKRDAKDRQRDMRDVRRELTDIATARARRGVRPVVASDQSIAVLPFDNLSGSDDEYFADGITEEILNTLAQLDGLRVAARSSCFAFKGKREDPRVVAEKLDVATVLEGSVRRAGDRLRITAQLVNAADGYQLWSERYDRELTDVFHVQDEIASAIAMKLRGTLSGYASRGRGRRGTSSLEAYESFLRGRALLLKRGYFIADAIPFFENALSLDPNYADALAALSDGYRLLATFGAIPSSEAMPRAKKAAERALAIEPEQAEALATLADFEAQYNRDVARADEAWERALAVDPHNSRARVERPLFLFAFGEWTAERSVAAVRLAVPDDPLNAWSASMFAILLGLSGRKEESIAQGERAVGIDPESFFARIGLLRALCWAGEYGRAFEIAPAILASSGRHQMALGVLSRAYAKTGKLEVVRAIRDELDARSRMEHIAPFWQAPVAAWAGLQDEAMIHAERALVGRDPMALYANVMPEWELIRNDSGFPRLGAMVRHPT